MTFAIFSFGGGEIFLVFIAVLVLFGANKIPELAKMLGKGMIEFRKATNDIKKEFREGTEEFTKDLKESQKEIDTHVREIKHDMIESDNYDAYKNVENEQSLGTSNIDTSEDKIKSETKNDSAI